VWDDDDGPLDRADGDRPADRRRFRHGPSDWREGDDLVPYDGGGAPADGENAVATGGPQTKRGKATLVIVAVVAVLTTVVLCCVAISQAARLIEVDPTRL
jgi:hypothetical protein